MKTFRRMTAITVGAAVVLGASACAGDPGGEGGGEGGGGALHVLFAASPDTEVLKTSIPDFEEETGIEVEITEVPQDQIASRMRIETESNADTFDVAGFQYELIPSYADSLLPLDDHLSDEDRSDIIPAMLDAVTFDGTVYGQLYVATGQVLFYRTDLLDPAGVAVPTTWDEYVAAAQRLNDPANGVYGTIVTAKAVEEPVGMYLNYLYQNGGDVIDDDGNVVIDSPEAVEALQFMVDLVHTHRVAPPEAANLWTIDTTELFLDGRIALAPNWTYMWGAATAPDSGVKDTVAVAPLPCQAECALSLGGWTLSAFANTDRADDAAEFIRFMTDTDRQVTMALQGGNAPTRTSAAENAEVSAVPVYQVMAEALATAVPRTRYENYPAVEAALSTAISAAVAQTASAEDALGTARQQLEASLGR